MRALFLGLFGVSLISGFAPFNDWVLANTPLIGNFLPIGVLVLLLALLCLVQVPLHRMSPKRALRRGEMAVVLSMWLVGCAIPTSGFMRYVPGSIIAIHAHAAERPEYALLLSDAQLPDWLFPTFDRSDPAERGREAVVQDYVTRASGERERLVDWFDAVPWKRWLMPAMTWGALAIGLLGMGLLIPLILHRQWVHVERLPFPLAAVYLSLIEPPEQGRVLNSLFRSRLFWISAGAVFLVHLWNGLAVYDPRHVPALSLGFNFGSILADPPLNTVEWYCKRASLFFSVVGITFFLQANVSFSLWSFVILLQIVVVYLGMSNAELSGGVRMDQSTGAILGVAATTLIVARRHCMTVLRQMFRGERSGEPRGEFIPYSSAGWLLVLCSLLVTGWVTAIGLCRSNLTWNEVAWSVGAGVLTCAAAAAMITVLYRTVAETGLPFVQLAFVPTRFYVYLSRLPFLPLRPDPSSYFATGWFSQNFLLDQRESLAPFAGHALRIMDDGSREDPTRAGGLARVGSLVLALMTAFLVSGAAMLLVEYNVSDTIVSSGTSEVLNKWVMVDSTRAMLSNVQNFFRGSGPNDPHNVWLHLAIGAGIPLFLAGCRIRFSWWPLYPVGFLLMHTYAMQMCWFSIFVGWSLKTLAVRLGGSKALRELRPLFIGLIIGEACAAGFWLIGGIILYELGYDFSIVRLLPT